MFEKYLPDLIAGLNEISADELQETLATARSQSIQFDQSLQRQIVSAYQKSRSTEIRLRLAALLTLGDLSSFIDIDEIVHSLGNSDSRDLPAWLDCLSPIRRLVTQRCLELARPEGASLRNQYRVTQGLIDSLLNTETDSRLAAELLSYASPAQIVSFTRDASARIIC